MIYACKGNMTHGAVGLECEMGIQLCVMSRRGQVVGVCKKCFLLNMEYIRVCAPLNTAVGLRRFYLMLSPCTL